METQPGGWGRRPREQGQWDQRRASSWPGPRWEELGKPKDGLPGLCGWSIPRDGQSVAWARSAGALRVLVSDVSRVLRQ